MDMRIDQFVVPGATDELQQALDLMKELAKEINNLNSQMKGGESMLGQARGISEITNMQKALAEQNKQLVESFAKLTKAVAIYQERSSRRKGPEDDAAKKQKKEDAEWQRMLKEEEKENKKRADVRKKQLMEEYKERQKAAADRKKEIADAKKDFDDYSKHQIAAIEKARKAKEAADKQAERDRKQAAADQKKLDADLRKSEKEAEDAANAYLQLSKAYAAAALKAKNLQIQLGATHPTAIQSVRDAHNMGEELKKLDASVGQYGRNVGNYDSATRNLRGSLTQITRELPSISNGFQTFASAIGNNIAPAQEAIQNFIAEQAELAKEGKKTTSVWAAMGKSILSWQTLLLVGVTLLTTYSKEIGEMAEEFFGVDKEAKKAAESLKKVNDAFTEGLEAAEKSQGEEIAALQTLYNRATDVTMAYEARVQAVEDLQEQYPGYLGNFSKEAIMAGNAETAYKKLNEALIANTMIKARQAQLDEIATQLVAAEDAKTKIIADAAQKRLDIEILHNRGAYQNTATSAAKIRDQEIFITNEKERRDLEANKKELDRLKKMMADKGKIIEEESKKVSGLFVEPPDKAKKPKEPEDLFTEQMKAREEAIRRQIGIEEASAAQLAEINQGMAEDENRSFEDRLEAYKRFTLNKIQVAELAAKAEIAVIQMQLAEIERIEKLDAKKRTGEESKFLLQKGALQSQLTEATIKGQTAVFNATNEGQKAIFNLTEKHNKELSAEEKKEIDATTDYWLGVLKRQTDAKKQKDKDDKEKLDSQLRQMEDWTSAAQSLGEGFSQVMANIAEKRISGIDKQIEKLNEQLEIELEHIELTSRSEEEKTTRIALARAEAAAKEKALQEERAQTIKRQAEFNKAIMLTLTVITTAAAVMDAILKATTVPEKIAAGVAVGLEGASQIAAIATQQIPEYFEGTGDTPHVGGPARLFEGNLAEAVFEPGKRPWIGDKEGIYALRPGTEVVSNADLLQAAGPYALGLGPDGNRKTATQDSGFREGFDRVAKAIENKPVGSISITGDGIRHFVEAGNSLIEYERNLVR